MDVFIYYLCNKKKEMKAICFNEYKLGHKATEATCKSTRYSDKKLQTNLRYKVGFKISEIVINVLITILIIIIIIIFRYLALG